MALLAPPRRSDQGRTRPQPLPGPLVRGPRLDWLLLGATALLLVLGTLLVWSATRDHASINGGDPNAFLKRHLLNMGIGIVLALLVAATDYRWVRILVPLAYAASLAGLVLVLAMGSTINGSRSWILVGPLSIQPAEFAKLAVIAGMALIAAERAEARQGRLGSVDVLAMLAVAGLPAALILLQPDLGTMLVLTATVFGVLAVAGAHRAWLIGLLAAGVALATAVVQLGLLKAYQIDRFMAFTNPALDPRGAGYNTEQARIAIGNGGLLGQGLFSGSQTTAGFVPEQQTDFVFTVAGEELGLIGAGLLIVLFAALLWRALVIARDAQDRFGRIAAAGIACWLAFQAFQNIGMCLGIMPVTGVPLPLVSYGGSSMFATLMAIGLLINIRLRPDLDGYALRDRLTGR